MRNWIALRLLGLATWALPEGHPAIGVIYDAAATVDDPTWMERRDQWVRDGYISMPPNAALTGAEGVRVEGTVMQHPED